MTENSKSMVLASFAADSLALGAHWIYDTGAIERNLGRADKLLKPGPGSFHPTREKGDFTHYGDQTLVLLESLAAKKSFDLLDFSTRWRGLFQNYDGYFDQATKGALQNFSSGKGPDESGSFSQDLAGASRIAPLVCLYREDPDAMVSASRAQTKMTHNTSLVLDSAEFFARVAFKVLKGEAPVSAMEGVGSAEFGTSPIAEWVTQGIASRGDETISAIGRFGQSCHKEEAFPAVVHLIARYEEDLREALVQCVMAGGDSAGRGMMAGMVLGAYLGHEALPQEWVSGLSKGSEILGLIDGL